MMVFASFIASVRVISTHKPMAIEAASRKTAAISKFITPEPSDWSKQAFPPLRWPFALHHVATPSRTGHQGRKLSLKQKPISMRGGEQLVAAEAPLRSGARRGSRLRLGCAARTTRKCIEESFFPPFVRSSLLRG